MTTDLVCDCLHRLCVLRLGHSVDDIASHLREPGWHLPHHQRLVGVVEGVDADSWRPSKHLSHTALTSVSKTNLSVFN